MAGAGEPTDWFSRHGWEATNSLPLDYEGEYRQLIAERRQLTSATKALQLVEQPNFKRRWYHPNFSQQEKIALRLFLLDLLESLFETQSQPAVRSVRDLTAELGRNPRAVAVAEVYTSEAAPELERVVTDLVQDEGVPYLAQLRFTDEGLEKYAAWCETWDLQRREDAGEDVGAIPVPPKYARADYRRSEYWTHRGKLGVPKERFVLYDGAETDDDNSPRVGWAGWDHLQRATALSGLYQQRKKEEGWTGGRLVPLLAGLQDLVPWLLQWHNEPDPQFGPLGDFFRDFVASEAQQLGLHLGDLEDWRSRAPTRGRSVKAATARGGSRGRKPSLDAETLVAAVERLQADGDVDLAQLIKDLGVGKQTVSKVAKACVAAGELEQTSGRPLRFRRA